MRPNPPSHRPFPASARGRDRLMDLRKAQAETAGPLGSTTIEARVDAVDWAGVQAGLDAEGWATAPKLLTRAEADALAGLYPQDQGFRSRVVMSRHGFGR